MTDEYFFGIAQAVSEGSKCNRLKVGAVIVRPDNTIASTGFNGTPRGYPNECEEDGVTLPTVIHAEMNAILFAREALDGYTIYITHSPCQRCQAFIQQVGLKVKYKEFYAGGTN